MFFVCTSLQSTVMCLTSFQLARCNKMLGIQFVASRSMVKIEETNQVGYMIAAGQRVGHVCETFKSQCDKLQCVEHPWEGVFKPLARVIKRKIAMCCETTLIFIMAKHSSIVKGHWSSRLLQKVAQEGISKGGIHTCKYL